MGSRASRIASTGPSRVAKPRWLVGLLRLHRASRRSMATGVASIHGAMVCSLGNADDAARAAVDRDTRAAPQGAQLARPRSWRRDRATGPLVGGNLAMLHACAAASARLRIPKGAVVLLEDIGERPYRVDRMLTQPDGGGPPRAGIGRARRRLHRLRTGPDGTTRRERCCASGSLELGVPVLAGMPVGHGAPQRRRSVLGQRAEVTAPLRQAVSVDGRAPV